MPTFRKGPIRAKFWDCSDPGRYFITVITAGRQPILGEILNGKMILSHIGEIVEEEWYKSFDIRKKLFCDIFQMMPDHLHAIVRIEPISTEGVHNPVPDVDEGTYGRFQCRRARPCAPALKTRQNKLPAFTTLTPFPSCTAMVKSLFSA